MGLQISEKKKRDYLINIIESYLKINIELMSYFKAVATERKQKLVCTKSMRSTEQAINHLRQIKHIEILDYLYSSFIGNSVVAYSVSGKLVLSKKLAEYDTDEGFLEFQKMLEEQAKELAEKEKQRKESEEIMKKAREQGKKVEYVYDEKIKKARPMIIDEKDNA